MLSLLSKAQQRHYLRYSRGARDGKARAAKRLYMQTRRAIARERREIFQARNPGVRYVVAGITHGTNGYTNHGCRCRTCNLSWKVKRVERERSAAA